ncbi:MAG TPA: ribosome-binding factor A [Candidatus Paceibacterota bacterium]
MKERRKKKLTNLIRNLAARFLEEQSNRTSLISVTRVDMIKGTDEMLIYLSIFPNSNEKRAYDFVVRKEFEFRNFVAGNIKTKRLPRFIFKIDLGEKNRQRIEELLKKS